MKPIVTELSERFKSAIEAACGLSDVEPAVRAATDERFGDYQADGVIRIAKRVEKKGPQLARQVVEKLQVGDMASEVSVAGPGFINLRLKAEFVRDRLLEMAADERLGVEPAAPPQTVVVDFSSPNVAKEMHIGHIRSTIIGDALCRIFEFRGHKVHRINHIGDWGTQFGMLIEYLRRTEPEVVAGKKRLEVEDLEEFYRKAKEAFDADPDFREAARREVVKLQQGELSSRRAWEAICRESRRKFQEVYDLLGIKIQEMGESFYNPLLPQVVDDLLKRGIARRSEGAVCVFLDSFKAPFIVQKRDGGYLYATTDLAALKYRIEKLGADRIVYVTDTRQRDHFRQLFATARLAGYAPAHVRLDHAAFGSILGKDGKPLKTREGRNVRLREVIEEAIQRARRVVQEKNPDLPVEEQEGIARIVGIGAIKYADLSQNPASDYVFDWDKMLSLDGDTAPYLQYAYARIRSIFRKGCLNPEDFRTKAPAVSEKDERRLALWLLRYNEMVTAAENECRPNLIANFLYQLAVRFTLFYNECPVLKAPPEVREARLALSDLTARVLKHGLGLLGIEVSERM